MSTTDVAARHEGRTAAGSILRRTSRKGIRGGTRMTGGTCKCRRGKSSSLACYRSTGGFLRRTSRKGIKEEHVSVDAGRARRWPATVAPEVYYAERRVKAFKEERVSVDAGRARCWPATVAPEAFYAERRVKT
ncbi:hypothetical protein FIBSPDRAFT_897625 [Athelia psychrophila]|uniref:Uncharacterized protein n=1 Tax=Athelia psychrophila TaxID=1759441 RepID=A0A166BYX1_9AGAM|nr:hypothetical protein FIBSPDRAFT_897625 [Fibularhizoctonia sp. CBS 109695]